jgi:hypothetical protein
MSERQSANPWGFVFNTPLECGLRSAALLLAAYPAAYDLQRLVQYDYLLVHTGDVDGGPESMHPATPHRSGELLVRRSLVEQGLEFMIRKMVVEKTFTGHGIGYKAGEYAFEFIDSLTTDYAMKLKSRAEWVIDRFKDVSDIELSEFMWSRWTKWGAEFVKESLFELEE